MLDAIKTTFERDPAAKWADLPFYPHLYALGLHRLAHVFYVWKIPGLPRAISALSRFLTGIDIHPGAKIGKGLFIDHGTGVVIGETAVILDNCTLFQGVTLGGTGKERGKRHPNLGRNVMVAAGAKILGNITIGHNVKVGANAVVLHSVPSNSTVVGVPGRVVRVHGKKVGTSLDHGDIPDPMRPFVEKLHKLEKEIDRLRKKGR